MSLPVSISVFILLVLSIGMHEAAHARVGSYFGDTTTEEFGLNTWNPIPHILHNFWTCLLFPAILWFGMGFFMGGAAVPVRPENMHPRRLGYFCSVAAGPTMNLLLSVFFGLCFVGASAYTNSMFQPLPTIFFVVAQFNFLLFIFNLIPVPPLDGSTMLALAIPETRPLIEAMRGGGLFILMIIIYLSPTAAYYLFWPALQYGYGMMWAAQFVM